ncbi:hypothetical protein C8R45DRAFT_1220694 [Mycena sanguinolenta]|nr:hypothetical protein C8R45DRAFT_1220694 [Mycena sanguinolenta]
MAFSESVYSEDSRSLLDAQQFIQPLQLHVKPCRWIGVFKAPADLSTEEFMSRVSEMGRELAKVPALQQHMKWKEVSLANKEFDEEIRDLGFPTEDRVALLIGEAETIEDMRKIARDPTLKEIVQRGIKELGIGAGSMVFTADILRTHG